MSTLDFNLQEKSKVLEDSFKKELSETWSLLNEEPVLKKKIIQLIKLKEDLVKNAAVNVAKGRPHKSLSSDLERINQTIMKLIKPYALFSDLTRAFNKIQIEDGNHLVSNLKNVIDISKKLIHFINPEFIQDDNLGQVGESLAEQEEDDLEENEKSVIGDFASSIDLSAEDENNNAEEQKIVEENSSEEEELFENNSSSSASETNENNESDSDENSGSESDKNNDETEKNESSTEEEELFGALEPSQYSSPMRQSSPNFQSSPKMQHTYSSPKMHTSPKPEF